MYLIVDKYRIDGVLYLFTIKYLHTSKVSRDLSHMNFHIRLTTRRIFGQCSSYYYSNSSTVPENVVMPDIEDIEGFDGLGRKYILG